MPYSINGQTPYKLPSLPERMESSSADLYDLIEEVAANAIDISRWTPKELTSLESKIEKEKKVLKDSGLLKRAFIAIRYGTHLSQDCDKVLLRIKNIRAPS